MFSFFFPIYFILFFNLVCFLEFSLCHQHIHYASERRFSCEIDWKSKLKTLYMFICSYTRSPASYIYRYPSFMVWITGPRITSMSQILWEERMRNCLNIWIPRRIWTQSGRMHDLLPAVNWEVELQGKEPHMVGRVITSWCRSYSKAQRKASSQMLLKDHCNRPAGSTQTFRIASIYASL